MMRKCGRENVGARGRGGGGEVGYAKLRGLVVLVLGLLVTGLLWCLVEGWLVLN